MAVEELGSLVGEHPGGDVGTGREPGRLGHRQTTGRKCPGSWRRTAAGLTPLASATATADGFPATIVKPPPRQIKALQRHTGHILGQRLEGALESAGINPELDPRRAQRVLLHGGPRGDAVTQPVRGLRLPAFKARPTAGGRRRRFILGLDSPIRRRSAGGPEVDTRLPHSPRAGEPIQVPSYPARLGQVRPPPGSC